MVSALILLATAQMPKLFIQDVTWSPDGNTLAFTAAVNGKFGIYTSHIDGSEVKKLTPDLTKDMYANWSPDGKRMLIARKPDGASHRQLYTVSPDGSDAKQVTHTDGDDAYASYSPDGKKVVYMSSRQGHHHIFVADTDGMNEREITHSDKNDSNPVWSPNGDWIVFESDRYSDNDELMLIHPDGTGEIRLTENKLPDTFPRWHPDGMSILHESGEGETAGLYVTVVANKESRLVLPKAFFGSYSPDGSKIAAIGYIDGPSKQFLDRTFFIEIADADGANVRRLSIAMP